MITYQVEKLRDIQQEMEPLLEAHYHEVHAFIEEGILLDPDWDKYYALEDLGMVHTVTARSEGLLVGYYVSGLSYNLHYKANLYANNDVLYLDPALRNTGAALDMFAYVEKCYIELGVDVMTVHMKNTAPFKSLCGAMGMKEIETMYGKYIGGV